MNSMKNIKLPFITLLLLISFATVNAVLFTPALPNIANFFEISETTAQLTITWFLVGYAIGQLLYGPIANRLGRKPALYLGISLQILSSLLCVLAAITHTYELLVLGRFLLALGSGVGRKMTFTLVNECYEPKKASEIISYLMLAFAITPALGVLLSGLLNTYYGWTSCFYAGAIYGIFLLFLVTRLPETHKVVNYEALKIKTLLQGYASQFTNFQLTIGGLLMGSTTCFIYVFAAMAPFIAMNIFGMNSAEYGLANMLPPIGIIFGSIVGARLSKIYPLKSIIQTGICITILAVIAMYILIVMHVSALISLFLPMIIINFGLCFIFANASTIAMTHTNDKANGSAVMNFLCLGLVTLVVLSLSLFSLKSLLLPVIYFILCIVIIGMFKLISKNKEKDARPVATAE